MIFEIILFTVFGVCMYILITHWMTFLVVKYSKYAKVERQIINYLCEEYLRSFDENKEDNTGYE